MIRAYLILITLLATASLFAADDTDDAFLLLQFDKQPAETLSFFVSHAPVESVVSAKEPVKFEPLPQDITAHLLDIGDLMGRRLFAVRYLSDSRLAHGNAGAVGLVLLCNVPSDQSRFAPLLVAWGEEEGTIDDYSVSPVRQLDGFSFIWVRRDYSGTANSVERMAITAPDAGAPLRGYPMFDDTNPLIELKNQGWELWHRGNFFDEDTLTWHYHLHRDPAKAQPKGEYPHRRVRVRYKFQDGKLRPGKAEEDEETGG